MLHLPNNGEVIWDGVKAIEIRQVESEFGHLCGLCGTYGDPSYVNENVKQMGPNTEDNPICAARAAPSGSYGETVRPALNIQIPIVIATGKGREAISRCRKKIIYNKYSQSVHQTVRSDQYMHWTAKNTMLHYYALLL